LTGERPRRVGIKSLSTPDSDLEGDKHHGPFWN